MVEKLNHLPRQMTKQLAIRIMVYLHLWFFLLEYCFISTWSRVTVYAGSPRILTLLLKDIIRYKI